MAAGGSSRRPDTSPSVAWTASQISDGSCSTRPGIGKCWVNSRCAESTARPSSSNAMVRTLVVPASMASTTAAAPNSKTAALMPGPARQSANSSGALHPAADSHALPVPNSSGRE